MTESRKVGLSVETDRDGAHPRRQGVSRALGNKPTDAVAESVRLMRDSLLNYSGTLIQGLIGIILVPILLRGLGAEPYALWIAVLSAGSLPAGFDFGLGWSVEREVAAARGGGDREETCRFVASAGSAYVVLGLAGGLVVALLGLPLSTGMHLSPGTQRVAPPIFVLAGIGFIGDRLLEFCNAILRGLRRFDVSSLQLSVIVLVRAAGIVVLLLQGSGITALAAWVAFSSLLSAGMGLLIVSRLEPLYHSPLGCFHWRAVRPHLVFGLGSQLTALAGRVTDLTPVLIGLVASSLAIVPYYVGVRFPLSLYTLVFCFGAVLFPAASEYQRKQDLPSTQKALEVGTRWVLVIAFPPCILLWIVAPHLLQAWVGEAQPETVMILRITAAAVLGGALGEAGTQILLGRGAVREVLLITVGFALSYLALGLGFLIRVGVVGIAWAMLVTWWLSSLAFVFVASRRCGLRPLGFLRSTLRGLWLPVGACAAVAFFTNESLHATKWPGVIAITLAAGTAYGLTFYAVGSRQEERTLAREVATMPLTLASRVYRGIRRGVGSES